MNANTAAYAIGDFRKMVNYENLKNKGYVRFTLGSDGGLKLEKFNRKIDLPLSWRSNTSAAHRRRRSLVVVALPFAYRDGMDEYKGVMRYLREAKTPWNLRIVRHSFCADTFAGFPVDDVAG